MTDFASSRLLQAMPGNYFADCSRRIKGYLDKGIDLIRLETGSPDQPTPEPIIAALEHAAHLPENHGYPPFDGKTSLCEAIARFYARHYGVVLDPETEITVFAGATIAVAALPLALLNPGDVMLTTDPGYPMYYVCPQLAGAQAYGIAVDAKHTFLPDYRSVPEDVLQKARLLMLNYPNNPTGAVATEDFFADTVAFSRANDIPVAHDFAYGALGFDGKRPLSFLQTPGAKEQGIEICTFSKTYNMAGWRLGFAAGNAALIGALAKVHDLAYSDVFGAVQDAGIAALDGSQDSVRDLCARYQRRRDVLIAALREIGWKVEAPKGSFFCWLPVPCGYTSESFTQALLERAHVAVAPGAGFGKAGDAYVRASLLEPEARLREAARRIAGSGVLRGACENSRK
ncbi:MAG: aminotransferase class I/II-fold pyridoxal phosphate-dependent enzyme [Sporolactobacillus sp.]